MSQSLAIGAWLVLALLAANLPWLTDRVLLVLPPGAAGKGPWMRLLEWCLMVVLVMAVGLGLEQKVTGGRHAQDWEFYVVSACLMVVAAVPGFVYHSQLRGLLRRRR